MRCPECNQLLANNVRGIRSHYTHKHPDVPREEWPCSAYEQSMVDRGVARTKVRNGEQVTPEEFAKVRSDQAISRAGDRAKY